MEHSPMHIRSGDLRPLGLVVPLALRQVEGGEEDKDLYAEVSEE
jgi:hypothetical protein